MNPNEREITDITLSSTGIRNIYAAIAPSRLAETELDYLVEITQRAAFINGIRLSERDLLRLLIGNHLSTIGVDPFFTFHGLLGVRSTATRLRHELYKATMRHLDSEALSETRWTAKSGFGNDPTHIRKPAADRWQHILRTGLHVGDQVHTFSTSTRWTISGIASNCMTRISLDSHTALVCPKTLRHPLLVENTLKH